MHNLNFWRLEQQQLFIPNNINIYCFAAALDDLSEENCRNLH
jgi:hypothetical protein